MVTTEEIKRKLSIKKTWEFWKPYFRGLIDFWKESKIQNSFLYDLNTRPKLYEIPNQFQYDTIKTVSY